MSGSNTLVSDTIMVMQLTLGITAYVGCPLLAFAYDRRHGGQGVLAAWLGGIVGGVVFGMFYALTPHNEPLLTFGPIGNFIACVVLFAFTGAMFGLTVGVAAWILAALASSAKAIHTARRRT
jgi:hypothetical protein